MYLRKKSLKCFLNVKEKIVTKDSCYRRDLKKSMDKNFFEATSFKEALLYELKKSVFNNQFLYH